MKSTWQIHSIWPWISQVGLCASIFVLGVVSTDRENVPLLLGLVGFGSICWLLCWRSGKFGLRTVLVYAFLFRLSLIALPPSLSDDAYRYVWDGLIQHEGANPYEFTPEAAPFEDLQQDLAYDRLNSKSFVSVYPPVSQLIFRVGTLIHTPDSLRSYYLIKGIFVLAELFAIILLARIVSSGFVLFYAWNPVVILETAGQAHTESAVLLALILVLYMFRKGNGRWAAVFLAIAGWIKLLPFFFFPFLWRRCGWRSVWPAAVVSAILVLPFAAPDVIGNVFGSLDLYARFFEFNAGFYYSLKAAMQWLTGDDWSKQLGPLLRLIFLCALPILYILDAKQKWPLARAMLMTTGCYLVLTTTVHPWYLLVPLFLVASLQTYGWHWIWLGVCSMGTYFLYVGGPYWTFVILGWAGWGIWGIIRYAPRWLQMVMHLRAKIKFKYIQPFFSRTHSSMTVLDLGCAEGYVGDVIHHKLGADVSLADVVSFNQTKLPHTVIQPGKLPWPSNKFDVVLLCFVLHHAEDPEELLQEAMRISRSRVIIVESVYTSSLQLKLLTAFDRFANRLRSFGKMKSQEEHLNFRTANEWCTLFHTYRAELLGEFRRGVGPFRSAGFLLRPASTIAQTETASEE